jgi:monoamine oxidase
MAKDSRRNFLRVGGATALGTLLGGSRLLSPLTAAELPLDLKAPAPDDASSRYDVVIIGAGVSGLVAARDLLHQGVARVKVLEARDRVGGRTLNKVLARGAIAEQGGQWIGPTQTAVLDLMNDLGITKFPTHNQGRMVDDTKGNLTAADYADYLQAQTRLDNLSKSVPLDAPWTAPKAAQRDAMTLRDWMNRNMLTKGGKEIIELEVSTSLAAGAKEISFLYYLFHLHSCTSMEHVGTHAQSWRITGGAQSIAFELAAQLSGVIETGAMVQAIAYRDRGALIQYNGRVIAAKKVIIAMMPADVDRIQFHPPLPQDRTALQKNWGTGSGMKVHAVYDQPFWRNSGLSGQAISDGQFIAVCSDNSPASGSVGVLIGFPIVDRGLPIGEKLIRKLTLRSFAHFFGPQALNPIDFTTYDWYRDPLASGCVSPLGPGVLTGYGPALRMPIESIHWAGTETSEKWHGYIDGAVRAGKRCAHEVRVLLP